MALSKCRIINQTEVFLKSQYKFIFSCVALLLIQACSNNNQEVPVEKKGFFSKDTTLKYAKRFGISRQSNYKALFLFGNRDSNDTTATFILYPKSQQKPNLGNDVFYVATPVNNIACMSSVYAAMLTMLNLQEKIVAVDNVDYYNNKFIIDGVASQKIKEIGKGPQISVEQTLVLNPELLLMFGMGNPKKDADEKILNSGIPVAITLDHLEEHPLARAEWIKFIAAFFDMDGEANFLFKGIERNYLRLKEMTDTISYKPTVLTEIKYADAWYVPGGNSFMAHFLKDAGADYIWKNENKAGSIALNFEEVYIKAKEADFWLNLFINVNSKKDLLAYDERYDLFKPFKTANLYNNTKRTNAKGYSDYYENGMSNPDELLRDFIKIFHPHLLPEHQLKYYKKIE
ncbi:MAG: ABC transporter substrate-binding protein [Sphingobacteriaceae bacterium]|nr:ABC transporter substrate-binding protein [Sphingobacteriaceae bacterium]